MWLTRLSSRFGRFQVFFHVRKTARNSTWPRSTAGSHAAFADVVWRLFLWGVLASPAVRQSNDSVTRQLRRVLAQLRTRSRGRLQSLPEEARWSRRNLTDSAFNSASGCSPIICYDLSFSATRVQLVNANRHVMNGSTACQTMAKNQPAKTGKKGIRNDFS